MLTCRLDTKDDTPNGKNIVRLPVPSRIAAPFSPGECLSDVVTRRADAAPTDNAAAVISAKERSESRSKEGPLVIPAREQPESSSRDGNPFSLPSRITWAAQRQTQNPSNFHPTFRYRSTQHTNLMDHRIRHRLKALTPTTPKPTSKKTPPCESTLGNDLTRRQVIST
jgi:hypothetical protein